MSVIPATSPPAGSTPTPAAPIEPVGTAPEPQAPASADPAISGGTPPASGASVQTPQPSAADLAFDAYLAEPVAADNQQPAPAPAPAAEQQPASASEAASAPPAESPPASEPQAPAPAADEHDPTPSELQAGTVKVDKLTRALRVRRQALDEAETAKKELAQERAITDQVLQTFNASGVRAEQLTPFLVAMSKARTDPQAQAMVLQTLGITPTVQATPAPQVDLAALQKHLDAFEVDEAKALLATALAPPAQPQQVQQPQQAPPAIAPTKSTEQPPRHADQAEQNELIRTVATMGNVLRATYGPQEAKRLADLVDAQAKAEVQRLLDIEVDVTPRSAAKIWTAAHEAVLKAEASRQKPDMASSKPVQTTALRPQQVPAPPAQRKSADDLFNEGAWREQPSA